MNYFNFNGKLLLENTPVITPANRGLRYGDGLFETIKYINEQLILPDEHFARLWKGLQLMQFDIPKLFSPDFLQDQILQLIKKNKFSSARIRLTILRGDGGLYDAKNHLPIFIIQAAAFSNEKPSLNENGLHLCIYHEAKKTIDNFSNLKHNNFLPYFMGALFAKQQQCNDAIILNSNNMISDSTIANIFLIKNEIIYTPALDQGCVAGVVRKFLVQHLPLLGYKIDEGIISGEMIMNAEEVFLTNSVYNMRWVSAIGEKAYSNIRTREIYNNLCKTYAGVFC